MRIVIADDERPARGFLASMLQSFEDVSIVGEAADGESAIQVIESSNPDLILLDIQMPGMDGWGLVDRLRNAGRLPLVVFVTAHDDHAVRAFDVEAVDYLHKPVTEARLREALDRARARLLEPGDGPPPDGSGQSSVPAQRRLDRIPLKHRGEIVLLPVPRIASIVAERELLHLTTDRRERFTIAYRLKDLEAQLDGSRFVRLSRGTLANVHHIARVVPKPGGVHTVHLRNGQDLSMSRIQSRLLRSRLLRL
jgi:two-component system LytT family response regulator